MDIAESINYEFLYTLDIRHPVSDEPIGLTMQIRSNNSESARAVLRKHTDKNLERRIKGRMLKADQVEQEELERVAASIASWDWGENSFHGDKPELTMRNAMRVLKELDWVFTQVKGASENIANFSQG